MTAVDIHAEIRSLRQRLYELSKAVAGDAPAEEIPEGELTILICRVDDGRVGFLHQALEEVVPMPTLTPILESPPWIAGLLNLRGQSLPVVDIAARIERCERLQVPSDFVVVARQGDGRIGLVVQGLEDVRVAPRAQLEPPPRDLPFAPYLLGVVSLQDESYATAIPLISVQRLVATSELPEEIA